MDQLGGRAQVFEVQGFKHDAGPTVITAPFLFEELFQLSKKNKEIAAKEIANTIKRKGYIEESKNKASELIKSSINDIEIIDKNNVYIKSLEDLAYYSMNREK